MSLYRKIHVGLFAIFATLLVVGALSLLALQGAAEKQRWVRHSHGVMSHLANLSWAIDNAQVSGQAFALNGSDKSLHEALAARRRADAERRILLDLTADNLAQQLRLDALAGLARPIAFDQMKTAGNGSLAIELDTYREVPHLMAQAESGLLREREAQMPQSFGRANAAVASGMFLGLVFFVFALRFVRRDKVAVTQARTEDDERMRVLVEGVQDYAIYMLDPLGKIVSWNAGARRIKGYEASEIIGQNFSCFYPQSDVDAGLPQQDLRLAAASGRLEVERWRLRKDGTRFLTSMVITAALDLRGDLVGFSEISHDLSERKESEARYRGLLEAAPDAMVVVDQGGKIVLLNLQAEKQFGYRRDELLGQEVTNIIPEGFAERIIADGTRTAAEALAQQIGTGIELIARRKDGSEFPIEIMLSPLLSKEEVLVTAAIRDITVRKGEAAKYRGLLEAAPDAMVVVDKAGKIVLLNAQAEKQFGYRRDELLSQQVTAIIPEGFAERLIADGTRTAAEALAQQIGTGIELVAQRKDGSEFPIELMLSPLESTDGILVTAAIRDISVRRKAEAHLAEMESRYRGLLEAAPEAIMISDPAGRISLVNAQMEKVFGYPRGELVGQPVEMLVPERFRGRHPALRTGYNRRAGARPMGKDLDLRGLRKDASEFPVEITLSPLETPEGLLITAVIRDITERRKFQEHLLQTVGELKRSNDELEHFAYVASHDLQEPLRMVASYTQLLGKRYHGRLDADADDFINYAVDGSKRMQVLINDLLAYSRAGATTRKPGRISSEHALQNALGNLQQTIADSGAIVTHDALPEVVMDEIQLTQVFQNLVGNAVKYRRVEAPRVHISAATQEGTESVFSVRDNGLGIEAQYFDKIFVLFQRLHGRTEFEGTGIGLAICKKMLERLGGRIWVESVAEQGSTFHFAVPAGAST